MADNKKICDAEENPSEQSELQEPSQQESLQPQQTSLPQQSTSEQTPESSPASTLQQDIPKWLSGLSEQSSPTFNPAVLTIEEQIAYLTHKYSSMDEPACHIDAMPRRPGPTQKPQPSPVLHNRVPSLGSPERRKFHYEKFLYKCRQFNSPLPQVQQSLPPSWQAVQQYSSQTPPESGSENFNQDKVQGWLSTLRKHEKEQDEKTKKELEEKAKKEQEENAKMEQEGIPKKEEEKMELSEEEQYMDVDSPENPDI